MGLTFRCNNRYIDVIQAYNTQPDIVDEPSVGLEDWTPRIALVDDTSLGRTNPDLGTLEGNLINSKYMVTKNDTHHIHNVEPVIDLSLVNRHLIDWSQISQEPQLLTFQNDYEIACYLNVIEPVVSSTSELATSMIEPYIKYFSHKIKRK